MPIRRYNFTLKERPINPPESGSCDFVRETPTIDPFHGDAYFKARLLVKLCELENDYVNLSDGHLDIDRGSIDVEQNGEIAHITYTSWDGTFHAATLGKGQEEDPIITAYPCEKPECEAWKKGEDCTGGIKITEAFHWVER